MKIAKYKPIAYHKETRQRTIINEETNESIVEEYEVDVPEMGVVYRDMTPEEEQAYLAEQANLPAPEPTPEERIAELESALSALLEGRVE